MTLDPVETNPQHYTVVYENDRVRVLEYTDRPGDRTTPHEHPDSVMHTSARSGDGCTRAGTTARTTATSTCRRD